MKNGILLIFNDDDNKFNFENAFVSRHGKGSRLEICTHLGFSSDSVIIYEGDLGAPGMIDIRYFTPASQEGRFIEFYTFEPCGLPVYLQNASQSRLAFLSPDGLIDLEPGEKKMVCAERVAADSHERYKEYRESIRQRFGLKRGDGTYAETF